MATTPEQNRILIIEDDASIRGLMAKHFVRHGYQVEQAEAVEEVLERFGETLPHFDVVVTDVHLPGESGVEFARRIKKTEPGQAVVFMTGDSDDGVAREALRSGASSFLVKPFQFSEMDTAVRNAVQRQRGQMNVTVNVVMPPARSHRMRLPKLRVAAAVAALLAMGWFAGAGFHAAASTPSEAPVQAAVSQPSSKPMVVPVVVEKPVYRQQQQR